MRAAPVPETARLQATMAGAFRVDVVPDLFAPDNPALAGAWGPAQRLLVVRDAVAGDRAELLAGYLRAAQRRGALDDFLLVDGGGAHWGYVVEAAVKAQLGRRDAVVAFGGGRTGRLVAVAAASFRRHTAAVRVHRDLAAVVSCLGDGLRAAVDEESITALTRRTHVIVDEDGVLAPRQRPPGERAALLLLALLDRQLLDRCAGSGVDGGAALDAVVRLCRRLGPGHPGWRLGDAWLPLAPAGLPEAERRGWSLVTAARVAYRLGLLPAEAAHSVDALARRLDLSGESGTVDADIVRQWLTRHEGAVTLPTVDGVERLVVDAGTLLGALADRPATAPPARRSTPSGARMATRMRLRWDMPASFPVRFTDSVYDPAALADLLPERGQVLAVVDPYAPDQVDRVHRLLAEHRDRGHLARFTVLPMAATERTKTMDRVTRVLHAAEGLGLGGDDRLLVIGGGTLLDIAGYAAYLYRRDTPYIRVPTTLVGMIDAGIGLKVGVNLNSHKNLLGAYHPPLACVCDTAFLRTLAPAELRCGLAEAIKMGAICDARLFELLEEHHADVLAARDTPAVREILHRSIAAMLSQLSANPFEEDLRRLPDFGHEFGHALESMSRYRLRHGEAVAIGMALSSHLAWRTGYLARADLDRLLTLLDRAGLALHDAVCDPDVLWRRLNDEVVPHKAGRLHLVVPRRMGAGDFIDSLEAINPDLVREACAELSVWHVDGKR